MMFKSICKKVLVLTMVCSTLLCSFLTMETSASAADITVSDVEMVRYKYIRANETWEPCYGFAIPIVDDAATNEINIDGTTYKINDNLGFTFKLTNNTEKEKRAFVVWAEYNNDNLISTKVDKITLSASETDVSGSIYATPTQSGSTYKLFVWENDSMTPLCKNRTAKNLIPNSSFEDGIDGWSAQDSTVTVSESDLHNSGSKSLKVEQSAANGRGAKYNIKDIILENGPGRYWLNCAFRGDDAEWLDGTTKKTCVVNMNIASGATSKLNFSTMTVAGLGATKYDTWLEFGRYNPSVAKQGGYIDISETLYELIKNDTTKTPVNLLIVPSFNKHAVNFYIDDVSMIKVD